MNLLFDFVVGSDVVIVMTIMSIDVIVVVVVVVVVVLENNIDNADIKNKTYYVCTSMQ